MRSAFLSRDATTQGYSRRYFQIYIKIIQLDSNNRSPGPGKDYSLTALTGPILLVQRNSGILRTQYWAQRTQPRKIFGREVRQKRQLLALSPRHRRLDASVLLIKHWVEAGIYPISPRLAQSLETMRERIAKVIGKFAVLREFAIWLPANRPASQGH